MFFAINQSYILIYTFIKIQQMPLEDFQIGSDLGKGSFGCVVKCIRRSEGEVYAMKQIKLQKLKDKDKKNALNQIRFLASISSPFIVQYKQAFYDQPSQKLCIVMEYANQGDLQSKIKKAIANKIRIAQEEIWKVSYQSLAGLEKLHDANIIHRDIKPANIFFHNGITKIGDLNVAKHLTDPFTVTQTGTPYYASPQVWSQQPYNFKSDIWSLGCVLYQMAMQKPPFRAQTPDKLYKKIMIGQYQKISSPYSKQLSSFVSLLMIHNQKKRPPIKQLLTHPKMLQIKCQDQQIKTQDDKLLKTIKFPTNLKSLNDNLPKAKYEQKVKTSKNIRIQADQTPQLIKKLPIMKSMKNIGSQKQIPLIDLPSKNMSIKQLIAARRPKVLNKCGSQKLIF